MVLPLLVNEHGHNIQPHNIRGDQNLILSRVGGVKMKKPSRQVALSDNFFKTIFRLATPLNMQSPD